MEEDERIYFRIYDFLKKGVGGKSLPSGRTTRWNSAMGRVNTVVTKVRGSYGQALEGLGRREIKTYENNRDDCKDHDSLGLFSGRDCFVAAYAGFEHVGLLLFEIEEVFQLRKGLANGRRMR
jgi:hypothetical protein